MKLNYKKLGQGKPLIILHGLLGMLDNWQSVGRMLSENYEVWLLDARNHGHSPHSDVFSYSAMEDDLKEFIDDQKKSSPGFMENEICLLGHSMGGKTAMKFAQHYPALVKKLIVVDISPRQYPIHHDTIFNALKAVDLDVVKSRKEAEEILSRHIRETAVMQFLSKNLYWKEAGRLAWRFNLKAIIESDEKIVEATTDAIFQGATLFIKGERSAYIGKEDEDLIKKYFPKAEIRTIPNAGHWVHAEQPALFAEAVIQFLES